MYSMVTIVDNTVLYTKILLTEWLLGFSLHTHRDTHKVTM